MAAAPLDDPRSFMEWLVAQAGSQAELARRSELLSSTISDYVRGPEAGGNDPLLPNVLKMLRGLDVRIEGMEPRQDPIGEVREMVAEALEMLRRGARRGG